MYHVRILSYFDSGYVYICLFKCSCKQIQMFQYKNAVEIKDTDLGYTFSVTEKKNDVGILA